VPYLPPDAVGWKVTRFRFMARQKLPDLSPLVAQVRRRDASGDPTTEILDQVFFDEAELPPPDAYGWVEIAFDLATSIPADEGVCVAVGMLAGDDGGDVLYQDGLGTTTPANQVYLGAPGAWSSNPSRDIPCEIDGSVQMPLE
jgi:hypothetical protein